MDDWVLWLIAAGVLGVAEMLTLTFVLGMLAVAAAVAAVAAGIGLPPAVQLGVFAGIVHCWVVGSYEIPLKLTWT